MKQQQIKVTSLKMWGDEKKLKALNKHTFHNFFWDGKKARGST